MSKHFTYLAEPWKSRTLLFDFADTHFDENIKFFKQLHGRKFILKLTKLQYHNIGNLLQIVSLHKEPTENLELDPSPNHMPIHLAPLILHILIDTQMQIQAILIKAQHLIITNRDRRVILHPNQLIQRGKIDFVGIAVELVVFYLEKLVDELLQLGLVPTQENTTQFTLAH
jgi:hypothetical protein